LHGCSSLPDDPIEPHNVNRELILLDEIVDDALKLLDMEVDMERSENRDGALKSRIRWVWGCAMHSADACSEVSFRFGSCRDGPCLHGVLPIC